MLVKQVAFILSLALVYVHGQALITTLVETDAAGMVVTRLSTIIPTPAAPTTNRGTATDAPLQAEPQAPPAVAAPGGGAPPPGAQAPPAVRPTTAATTTGSPTDAPLLGEPKAPEQVVAPGGGAPPPGAMAPPPPRTTTVPPNAGATDHPSGIKPSGGRPDPTTNMTPQSQHIVSVQDYSYTDLVGSSFVVKSRPPTKVWYTVTISGVEVHTESEYYQYFSSQYTAVASASAGSIGLGSISGQVGVTHDPIFVTETPNFAYQYSVSPMFALPGFLYFLVSLL